VFEGSKNVFNTQKAHLKKKYSFGKKKIKNKSAFKDLKA
jgi:hypothetical protein